MRKLSKEKILERFKGWIVDCKASYIAFKYEWTKEDEQAYQQIIEMIQSHANLEQGVAQSQGKVTEEWIEEKAKELREGTYIAEPIHGYGLDLDIAKDFIRSLVKKIK